jgi:hypothetical protein
LGSGRFGIWHEVKRASAYREDMGEEAGEKVFQMIDEVADT